MAPDPKSLNYFRHGEPFFSAGNGYASTLN